MTEQADSDYEEGLEMLSRLFEEEVPQQDMLERLILPVPSSVEEQLYRHYEKVLARNEELECRLTVVEQEKKTLQEKNDLMRNNLTALYRTSLAEIRFRNLQIASLRKQLQLSITASERRTSSDTAKSSSISKQNMGGFHESGDQGNVPGVSRTEIISSLASDYCSKGTENTDKRRDLSTDIFASDLNLCVDSSSSVKYRHVTCSAVSPQLASSNTSNFCLNDANLIMPGTGMIHTLNVGHETPVSLSSMIPVQPQVSRCSLLKPENQKRRWETNRNINASSAMVDSLHLSSCSSLPDESAFQGVELKQSLLSSDPVMTSDIIISSLQEQSNSGTMLHDDRQEESTAKECSLGDRCADKTKLVNLEQLLGCTNTVLGKSKSNEKDCKRNTPALSNKELQSHLAINVKTKEIPLHLAEESNQNTACMKTGVPSQPVEPTVCSETRSDRMPQKSDNSEQTTSVEISEETESRSNPSKDIQNSVSRKTTQSLVRKTDLVKDKSHCPVKGIRTKEISPSSTKQREDFKLKLSPQISKAGSETVGSRGEVSKSETSLDYDLRLKLMAKSKAGVLHLETAKALCSRASKSLEKELETSSEPHKENSRAGKADLLGPSVLSLHQGTSSHSAHHHSHRERSESVEGFVSSQSSRVKGRQQKSDIENDDQRQACRKTENYERSDGPSHKRRLNDGETEMPTKKCRSDKSIQERLVKISIMNSNVSDQPGFAPKESKSSSDHEQRKYTTLFSNAKNLLKTPDLISTLAPEIEQLKRYVDMAEGHDVAQKISQREGEKHLSRLALQQKLTLDSERVQVTAPVETASQSTSGSSQKKPLNDHNTPSPTVFTLRSMAKLKQASLSRTHKQIGHSLEKGISNEVCSILAVSGGVTNNPPEVHNLAKTTVAQGNLNPVSVETSIKKLVYSSEKEKLAVISETSQVSFVMRHESKNLEDRLDANKLGTQSSSSSKKPIYQKPASTENLEILAVQKATCNTSSRPIQSMEESKTQPSEGARQDLLPQCLINKTNVKDVDRIFDSDILCQKNKELKVNVRKLLNSIFASSKSKPHFGTKQNEVDTVSQVEQLENKGSRQQSADGPAETLQSPDNLSQTSKSFTKLDLNRTPMEVNSDSYLGSKVDNDNQEEEGNVSHGEEVLSDIDADVSVTENNSKHSFDFLFDIAIAGATPAHVSDSTTEDFENENINFDEEFSASYALEQLENSTGEVTEAGQGSNVHAITENVGSTISVRQKVKRSHSEGRSNTVSETQDVLNRGQVETTLIADNAFSSDLDISSEKEMTLEHTDLQQSRKNRNLWIQVDKKPCEKNLSMSHTLTTTSWPTGGVELMPSSEILDEDSSRQISPFKLFLHNSDDQCGFSTTGKQGSSLSPLPRESLLQETARLSPAKNKASLPSVELTDLATGDVTFSDSELLQVHAPEENFDLYLSDTNDRLFGSVSESPSSFKSPELEDGADGVSKTAEKAKEFEEGEISDSEKDFPVVDCVSIKNYTKVVCDERSMPGRLTKKKSFNGWHSRIHPYGKSRTEKFSRETRRADVEQIQKNSAGREREKCKARSPRKCQSAEVISNMHSSKKGRLEDEDTKQTKERKDRTHSQERDHSRYSQEHSKCYEKRQRSRIHHGNETRKHRVSK